MPSIFGKRLFEADTLAEFWREWNLPVQRLLSNGVYKRALGRGFSQTTGRVLCFLVSGIGHAWPLLCAGAAGAELLQMTAFFLLQLPLLALESRLRLRCKHYLYGVLVLASPLFVNPMASAMAI